MRGVTSDPWPFHAIEPNSRSGVKRTRQDHQPALRIGIQHAFHGRNGDRRGMIFDPRVTALQDGAVAARCGVRQGNRDGFVARGSPVEPHDWSDVHAKRVIQLDRQAAGAASIHHRRHVTEDAIGKSDLRAGSGDGLGCTAPRYCDRRGLGSGSKMNSREIRSLAPEARLWRDRDWFSRLVWDRFPRRSRCRRKPTSSAVTNSPSTGTLTSGRLPSRPTMRWPGRRSSCRGRSFLPVGKIKSSDSLDSMGEDRGGQRNSGLGVRPEQPCAAGRGSFGNSAGGELGSSLGFCGDAVAMAAVGLGATRARQRGHEPIVVRMISVASGGRDRGASRFSAAAGARSTRAAPARRFAIERTAQACRAHASRWAQQFNERCERSRPLGRIARDAQRDGTDQLLGRLGGQMPHRDQRPAWTARSFARLLPPANGARPVSKCHHKHPQAYMSLAKVGGVPSAMRSGAR